MSVKTMSRVWEHAQASGGALLVLLVLADHADDDGYAWPNRETLSQKARLKERQVINVLAALTQAGDLAYLPGDGRGRQSLYCVLSGLTPDERQQRIAQLPDKAEELIMHLQAGRAIVQQLHGRKGAKNAALPSERVQKVQPLPQQRVQDLHPLPSERVQKVHPFDAKGCNLQQKKGAMPIAESGVSTPDSSLIHHVIHGGGRSTTTEAESSTDAAGGGGGQTWYEESYRLLRSAQVFEANARRHAAHPPERIQRIIAEAQRRTDVISLAGWITNALNLIDPYAPEVPHETVSTRSRAAARRAERPAGSGPPPGVRTFTAADLVAWGLADPTDGDEPPDVPEVRT
jgi:hypothetical protein